MILFKAVENKVIGTCRKETVSSAVTFSEFSSPKSFPPISSYLSLEVVFSRRDLYATV